MLRSWNASSNLWQKISIKATPEIHSKIKFSRNRFGILPLVLAFFFALAFGMLLPTSRAEAACPVPNTISNGQPADATAVMDNFNALKGCIDSLQGATVNWSGAPVAGNLSVFSGSNSVTSGNLSGDCTTSGTLATICTKANGAPFGYFATGTDAGQLTGTLSVNRFGNGENADTTHFLRGDGVWAVPPGTGGSGGATTPVVRASSISSFNGSSVSIPWPAGTIAGDVVVIFVSDGYAVYSPSGWTIFNNTGGNDWANGLTAAKVMTAADITAGAVTVTISGPYNGVAAALTVQGSTVVGVREVAAGRSAGSASYSSSSLAGLYTALNTDLVIGFTYARGAMNPSVSNFTQLQQLNAANASGFLGIYSTTLGKLGINETATYPAGNNGYYWSLVSFR